MKTTDFNDLQRGDIVKHKSDYHLYVVTGNYGGRATAVRSVDMTNPIEWVLVRKSTTKTDGGIPTDAGR